MRNGPIPAFPHSSDLEQYTAHRITIRSDGKDPISVSGKQVSPFSYTHTIKIFRITMHTRGDVSEFSIRSGFGTVRKWIFLRNRTHGATATQFMRRIAPAGRLNYTHICGQFFCTPSPEKWTTCVRRTHVIGHGVRYEPSNVDTCVLHMVFSDQRRIS